MPLTGEPRPTRKPWRLKTRTLPAGHRPHVMGIVNATPDSFSDGGRFSGPQAAIEHALRLLDQGAAIIDVGGESTRPYSQPVGTAEELDRVIPVIEGIVRRTDAIVSIDTSKAVVARAAVDAGAEIINDVTGLDGDPEMLSVALQSQAGICAMHMQGNPQTMQDDPSYENVVADILGYLDQRLASLTAAGILPARICLDPGIGFGKTHQHNLELLAACRTFKSLGAPVLIGHSRKGFIGKLLGDPERNRDIGTLAISVWLAHEGIEVLRVHEVRRTVEALRVVDGMWRQAIPDLAETEAET